MSGLNFEDLVEKITKRIEDLVGNVSEKAKECIKAQEKAIEDLAQQEQMGAQGCVTSAEAEIAIIYGEVQEIINEGNDAFNELINGMEDCRTHHTGHFLQLVNCLKGTIAPVVGDIKRIEKKIADLIKRLPEQVTQAETDLVKCMENLGVDLLSKEKVIVEDIGKCIIS